MRFADMPYEERYPEKYAHGEYLVQHACVASAQTRGNIQFTVRARPGRRVRYALYPQPQAPRSSEVRMLDRCEALRQELDKGKREPTTEQLVDRLHEIGREMYRLGWMDKPCWKRFLVQLAEWESELKGEDKDT